MPKPSKTTWLFPPRRIHTIDVHLRAPDGSHPVYVVGNHVGLGAWDPGHVEMVKLPNGVWHHRFQARRGTRLEFKFTRGSWETEAVNERGRTMRNFKHVVEADDQIDLTIAAWRDDSISADSKHVTQNEPEYAGQLIRHPQQKGSGLQPRDVLVWLPPGYDEDENVNYPVLYLHDGQNLFDPSKAYTGVHWQVDETLSALIESEEVQPVIVVGIENTPDRLEEYAPTRTGEQYMKFVVNRVKPFVDKNYRTRPEREHTATLGSSMGGLISFWLAWRYPDVFSMPGCMSPSFIFKRGLPFKQLKRTSNPDYPLRIYMDCGGIGGEKLLMKGCRKMIRRLRKRGILVGENFEFHQYPDADHSEVAWAARLEVPLRFFFAPPRR